MKKPLILVSNDDGISAPGIRALVEVAKSFGEVVVVAPNSPQSAKGHAITITKPLRLTASNIFEGIEAYEVNGTPVDCVKLGKHVVLKDRKIDLCLSGINHGSNAASNIIYSGTMSAAMEASLEKIPSIGFSLLDYTMEADFEPSKKYINKLVAHVLEHGMQEAHLLNVNIPKLSADEIKGFKICRAADARWVEAFVEREDPFGRKYYWLTGEFVNYDDGTDTDTHALDSGYISVVPATHDMTDHPAISGLKLMENIV